MSSVSTRPSCAAASMTCGSFDARPVPCSSWNDSTTRLACRARMPETMGHAAACNSQPPSAPRMQSAYRTIPIRIADNSWQAFSRALYPCRQPPGAARTDRIGAATTSACERIPGLEPGPRPRQGRALTAELHPQRAPPRCRPRAAKRYERGAAAVPQRQAAHRGFEPRSSHSECDVLPIGRMGIVLCYSRIPDAARVSEARTLFYGLRVRCITSHACGAKKLKEPYR